MSQAARLTTSERKTPRTHAEIRMALSAAGRLSRGPLAAYGERHAQPGPIHPLPIGVGKPNIVWSLERRLAQELIRPAVCLVSPSRLRTRNGPR